MRQDAFWIFVALAISLIAIPFSFEVLSLFCVLIPAVNTAINRYMIAWVAIVTSVLILHLSQKVNILSLSIFNIAYPEAPFLNFENISGALAVGAALLFAIVAVAPSAISGINSQIQKRSNSEIMHAAFAVILFVEFLKINAMIYWFGFHQEPGRVGVSLVNEIQTSPLVVIFLIGGTWASGIAFAALSHIAAKRLSRR